MGHNCTNPPHFPPHCGCPAGVTPGPEGTFLVRDGEVYRVTDSELVGSPAGGHRHLAVTITPMQRKS